MEEQAVGTQKPNLLVRVLGGAGVILYVAVGWLYLVSGLVVPSPWLFGLWAIWLGGWFFIARILRSRPAWTAAVAVAAAALWVVILYLGDSFLGWTA